MIFNPDANKQAKKLYLVEKKNTHPSLIFNNAIMSETNSRKHLGDTLDLKLTFEMHLLNVYKTVNRTIGFMCKLFLCKVYYQEKIQLPSKKSF